MIKELEPFLKELQAFLEAKNKNYGNSALEPLHIFAKENTNGIEQRLDDKLSRIKNSPMLRKNDTIDLLGYLVLLSLRNGWTNLKEMID
jgi:hypothetical protein